MASVNLSGSWNFIIGGLNGVIKSAKQPLIKLVSSRPDHGQLRPIFLQANRKERRQWVNEESKHWKAWSFQETGRGSFHSNLIVFFEKHHSNQLEKFPGPLCYHKKITGCFVLPHLLLCSIYDQKCWTTNWNWNSIIQDSKAQSDSAKGFKGAKKEPCNIHQITSWNAQFSRLFEIRTTWTTGKWL